MAPVYRVKVRWDGFSGAPGFSVFHMRDFAEGGGDGGDPTEAGAQAAADRIYGFFNAVRTQMPTSVDLSIEPEVELLEETTAELIDMFPVTSEATLSGSSASSFAGPVGAVVNWRTSVVHRGRRIRGRTFLVPLSMPSFTTGGVLATATLGPLRTAAEALIAPGGSPDLGVLARPSAPGASDGRWAAVTAANVPTMAAVLRSRRD